MTNTSATHKNSCYPHLLLIKGRVEYEQQVQTLASLAWQIAYAALWNGEQLSPADKQAATDFILAFIKGSADPRRGYMELVQRVLLARQFHIIHPDCFPFPPARWFGKNTRQGFPRTKKWFNSLETARQSLPMYKIGLIAFGEAVRIMHHNQNAKDFHYWRNYFIERHCHGLLNLFLSIVANMKRQS